MNYRHSYHAGSFADIVKHTVLIALLNALKQKDTPFCYLDTHAGAGLYELQSTQAKKTAEYINGVEKLFAATEKNIPDVIKQLVAIIKQYNSKNSLHCYPGSPLIAASLLRQQDQLILSELHPEDYQSLRRNLRYANTPASIATHHLDAYSGMKAFLPPKLKRGLVMIDPPFEKTDEFDQIISALTTALKHWRAGHYMIWYPIKNPTQVDCFYRDIKKLNVAYFKMQFRLKQKSEENKLTACGILLINPPWKLPELLEQVLLPYLEKVL